VRRSGGRGRDRLAAWIPLAEIQQRIAAGEIVGAGSVSGLLAVLLAKATGQL
jgi:hypothetical protein